MTDLMHAHAVADDIRPPQKSPETSHVCTVVVFMTALMAGIAAGIYGLWNLTVVYSDAYVRGFLIFASLYSSGSLFHFLGRIVRTAFRKGEPHIDRALVHIIRSLDGFFGSRPWCNRRLRNRDVDTPTTSRNEDPEPTTGQPVLA